ncbi:MAG: Na+/H+ antiporter [Verrucomicrobiales bacterium]|nr:Na+/H+ antiporter [Verrucomicrobiales bacterium]
MGWLTAWVLEKLEDPSIQITISLLTPYAAYLTAERFGVSGVLAVVSAGFYHGWRAPEILDARMRLQAGPIWDMIEFLLNGLLFILVGLQLPEVLRTLANRSTTQLVTYGVVFSFAVILIRLLWVFPATYLPRLLSKTIRDRDPAPSWRAVLILGWAGMRGGLSLAAALALPAAIKGGAPFPGRDLILFLTFSVILATLVAQGLSLPPLIRWLKLKDDGVNEREEQEARLHANHAALARLDEVAEKQKVDPEMLKRLRVEYEDRIRQLEAEEDQDGGKSRHLYSKDYERLAFEGLKTERQVILKLRNDRVINDETLRRIQRDIDLAEARLKYPGKG